MLILANLYNLIPFYFIVKGILNIENQIFKGLNEVLCIKLIEFKSLITISI